MIYINRFILVTVVFLLFNFSNIISTCAIEYKYPSNNKILVYAPGFSGTIDGQQNYIAEWASEEYFPKSYYFRFDLENSVLLKDRQASVDAVKSFGNYGTVIIHTHGWFWKDELPANDKIPVFRTGTIVPGSGREESGANNTSSACIIVDDITSWFNDPLSRQDLVNHRLAVSKKPDHTCNYQYTIFPAFIDAYVSEMDDTFLYLGYCHSMQNKKMWRAFKNAGAKVAFGFTEEMKRSFNENSFDELFTIER